jgi:RecA-family ATPase
MISAEPFVGKTMFMLYMMLCLDAGQPLFGRHKPTRPGRVLVIGQDAPTWDYIGQAQKLLKGMSLDSSDAVLESDLLLNSGLTISDHSFLSWLKEYYDSEPFSGILIDTLSAVHGADENSNQQMARIMGVLKEIRDTLRVFVLFSHHTTKPGSDAGPVSSNYRARGATSIVASVDFHLQMTRQGDRVRLLMPKGRGAEGEIAPFFELQDTADGGVSIVAPLPDNPSAKVIRLLIDGPTDRQAIADALAPETTKTVDNALQYLRKAGKITSKDGVWQIA